jgi:hypothetical protein
MPRFILLPKAAMSENADRPCERDRKAVLVVAVAVQVADPVPAQLGVQPLAAEA